MPLPISHTAIAEKNRLAAASAFIVLLEIAIPGLSEPVRVAGNSEDLDWRGQIWTRMEFSIEDIGDHAKGEIPRVEIRVANVGNVIGNYIRQYDNWTKLNGYSTLEVAIFVVNTLAIAPLAVTALSLTAPGIALAMCPGHRFSAGQEIHVSGADQSEYDGLHTITAVDTDAFSFAVAGEPATPATGDIAVSLASAEVEHRFDLKQPQFDNVWATFTLGASNPFNRRFPQAMISQNHCRFRFKSDRCGYPGAETVCDHTLSRCRALGNSIRFGGAPGVGNAGILID
jgi:phage-related protein